MPSLKEPRDTKRNKIKIANQKINIYNNKRKDYCSKGLKTTALLKERGGLGGPGGPFLGEGELKCLN
jgi:hypothetical protein